MYGPGLIAALLGIGSGVLKIPALDTALRLPIKVSSATSNFMIGVTAAASGVAYFVRGDIDPAIAGPVALGSVIGSVLGARFLMPYPATGCAFSSSSSLSPRLHKCCKPRFRAIRRFT
jgi:uncharacterized protein